MDKVKFNTHNLDESEIFLLVPTYFYKYASINRDLEENLEKGQLWYNTSNNFNDPFDCKALINFGITEIERKTNFEKFNNAFNTFQNTEYQDMLLSSIEVDKLISNIAAKSIENSIGVTCFSENFDNTLMWAHYADKHKGLVLEFKKDKNGSLYRNMLPINYYESYPVINVSDYSEDQMNSVLYQIIGAKGNDWEYENEWRAMVDLKSLTNLSSLG